MTFLRSFITQTEWVAYSPVYSVESGSVSLGNGTLNGRWARIHDSAMVAIYWNPGSTTTFEASDAIINFSLPPGIIIDTTKVTGSNLSGSGFCIDASTAANNIHCIPVRRGDDQIGFVPDGNFTARYDRPFLWTTGDELFLEFIIPVVGW